MDGTFVFLHGTGDQKHDENYQRIRAMLDENTHLAGFKLNNIRWGKPGPSRDDITRVLPPSATLDDSATAEDAVTGFAEYFAEAAQVGPQSGEAIPKVVLALLTDALEAYRLGLTTMAANFLQNVILYLADGSDIRDRVITELKSVDQSKPMVILGHSLGGIIGVDIASDPSVATRVDLLVTVGSQAPLLHVLGAIPAFENKPKAPRREPFSPWLNIYNPRDPLAFVGADVFGWASRAPEDHRLDEPRDLLGTHTDYDARPEVYRAIAKAFNELPPATD